MKSNQVISGLVFFTVFATAGCNKSLHNNKCLSYKETPVTMVQGPATAVINQEIALTVSYSIGNGCGKFEKLEQTTTGNTTTITVIGKYQGCICAEVILPGQTTYTFKASQAGTYELKFFYSSGSYITHTIVVT